MLRFPVRKFIFLLVCIELLMLYYSHLAFRKEQTPAIVYKEKQEERYERPIEVTERPPAPPSAQAS